MESLFSDPVAWRSVQSALVIGVAAVVAAATKSILKQLAYADAKRDAQIAQQKVIKEQQEQILQQMQEQRDGGTKKAVTAALVEGGVIGASAIITKGNG